MRASNQQYSGYDPPPGKTLNSLTCAGTARFFEPWRFELIGAHVGGALVGRRGWALTQGGALQTEQSPLHRAADNGDLEVVRSLLEAGADKDASFNVVGAVFHSRFDNSEISTYVKRLSPIGPPQKSGTKRGWPVKCPGWDTFEQPEHTLFGLARFSSWGQWQERAPSVVN